VPPPSDRLLTRDDKPASRNAGKPSAFQLFMVHLNSPLRSRLGVGISLNLVQRPKWIYSNSLDVAAELEQIVCIASSRVIPALTPVSLW